MDSLYPDIPSKCTSAWLDEQLGHALEEFSDRREALACWVRRARAAWGSLDALRFDLNRASYNTPRLADARRAIERVLLVEKRLRMLAAPKEETSHSAHHRPERAARKKRQPLFHLAALWGCRAGLPDGSPPPTRVVEDQLAILGQRYHREVAKLHQCRCANPVFYGPPRKVNLVTQQGRTLRRVRAAGVSLESVFRDPTTGRGFFRVKFLAAVGKRKFLLDLPVDCDLEAVELPKPRPAPALATPATDSEAHVNLLCRLAFAIEQPRDDLAEYELRFQGLLARRLTLLSRSHGIRRADDVSFALGRSECRGWCQARGNWDVTWGVSIEAVDLRECEVQARFDSPSGVQRAAIPLARIIEGVQPAKQIVDGILMVSAATGRQRWYVASVVDSDGSRTWLVERSVRELIEACPSLRPKKHYSWPRTARADAGLDVSGEVANGSLFQ